MPNFTVSELEALVHETVDRSSAPIGSARYAATRETLRKIAFEGDEFDQWIYVTGLCSFISDRLGLEGTHCPCGNPEHKPFFEFQRVPMRSDGHLDQSRAEAIDAPEAVLLSRILTAEVEDDAEASARVWKEAVRGGHALRMLGLAAFQVGNIQRTALHTMAVN
jgi:hypothetical protein